MSATGSITLVPTVHFSASHRRRVHESIRDAAPDLVAIELDEDRFERLEREISRTTADMELPPPTAATYRLLKAIQRTYVRLYGLDPGRTDMDAAI
jgi:pheromone shutdown protein TraB